MKYLIFILFSLQLDMYQCIRLESVKCESLDENFSKFDICELKPNKKNEPALTIYSRLLKPPVKNCLVAGEMIYVGSSIRRYIGNGTWDACAFMKNRKRYPILTRFYDVMINNTNLNHTCPYNHDIRVTDLAPAFFKWPLPLPNGAYLVTIKLIVDKIPRASVRIRMLLDF